MLRRGLIWSGAGALALLITPARAPGQCQVAKLRPADGGRNQILGRSVAIDGDAALLGAPGDSELASGSGAAFVYRHDGVHWNLEQKLIASDARRETVFGRAVALEGDLALIGTPYGDGLAWFTGATYVFERVGEVWSEITKLNPRDPREGAFFGSCVALDGGTAVVGTPHDSQRGAEAGAAYVFERDASGVWSQTAKLLANDAHFGDNLGHSVAVDGDVIVAGAPNAAPLGNWSGAAYVFERVGGVWSQTAKLIASDGSVFHSFGESVAVSSESILIGAWGAAGRELYTGAAYVFERIGPGQWAQTAKLVASDGANSDDFGFSVTMGSGVAIVGAPGTDAHGQSSGSGYVFGRSSSGWVETAKLLARDGGPWDKLGYSVSLSGDQVVIGAPFDDDLGEDSGSAYVFSLNGDLCECLAADLDGDGVVALGDLGILLADFGCAGGTPTLPCPGDIDHDGDTDLTDLGILLARFGEVCR